MNITDLKERVSKMSDAELRLLLVSVARAVGADEKKTAALTGDIAKTRKTISSLSEKQIAALLSGSGGNAVKELFPGLGSERR